MSEKTVSKTAQVTCTNAGCPQPKDSFLVRYEVEYRPEAEGGPLVKGIRDSEGVRPPPALTGYALITTTCPWCDRETRVQVPL